MLSYEIVFVHRDGTEEILQTVKNKSDIARITETPKYLGTWIRDNRKLLRWNRGELQVREKNEPMTITHHRAIHFAQTPLYELTVAHGEELRTINLNSHSMVGYDINKKILWQTSSMSKLADIVGKEVAYQVNSYYEQYLIEFNAEDAR